MKHMELKESSEVKTFGKVLEVSVYGRYVNIQLIRISNLVTSKHSHAYCNSK